MSHLLIKIRRDINEAPVGSCKENAGVKIGSFECTAKCKFNKNTRKEIETEAFDLEYVRCEIATTNNQLQIEI